MAVHKTEDVRKLHVETRAFIVELGVQPNALKPPRTELSGVRLKLPNAPAIFVVDPDGYRRWIPDPETYNNLFRGWDGVIIDVEIDEIPAASPLTRGAVLVRAADAAPVYLLSNGVKRWITSPAVMDRYHFNWSRIYVLPPAIVDAVPRGPDWA